MDLLLFICGNVNGPKEIYEVRLKYLFYIYDISGEIPIGRMAQWF